jgi:hypothetical protein
MPNCNFCISSIVTCLQLLNDNWYMAMTFVLFFYYCIWGSQVPIMLLSLNCRYFDLSVNASDHWYLSNTCLHMMYHVFAWGFVCLYMHKRIFLFIYDRLIDQACWRHSRRPLRRGVSPSSLVCILYSKISRLILILNYYSCV